MKIKSNGNQAFNVPNNREGKMFMYLAKKFVNNDRFNLHGRGRGSRIVNGVRISGDDSISQKKSEWMAVYINEKGRYSETHRAYSNGNNDATRRVIEEVVEMLNNKKIDWLQV